MIDKIEAEKYTVYSNTSTTEDAAKEVGRMLVDAKVRCYFFNVYFYTLLFSYSYLFLWPARNQSPTISVEIKCL